MEELGPGKTVNLITNEVPYTERSVVEAMQAIAEAIGDGWERIDDVAAAAKNAEI